jgi:hypothetical protein
MRPKGSIERSPHIICAQAILTTGQDIYHFCIREGHRSVAAEQEPFVAGAWFVQAMASLMQPKRFAQIAGKARDGVGIEFACYP